VEWALPTVAIALLAFAAVSGRLEGTPITGPMVFTAVGLLVGADTLGLVDPKVSSEAVKLLAEATLALVLFGDASRIDLRALRDEVSIPARLLGFGLPLTLIAGFGVALVLFGELAWPEALLLGVILAPTDAALGQAVVTLPRLPSRVRQGLNVESGLNDGICVPLFFVVLAIAQAEAGEVSDITAFRLVVEEIGWGLVGGLAAGALAAAIVVIGRRVRSVSDSWLQIVPVAAAVLAYSLADALGGSGFIAAFVGGMVFGGLRRRHGGEVGYLLEELGGVLNATTFIVFGAVMLGPSLGDLTWSIATYAVLSLTLVRMLPVGIAMLGTGARRPTVGFLGWFGPRGLASIVFAVILIEAGTLPNEALIVTTVMITIGLSVLLHGLTAAPLANRYAAWFESHPRDSRPTLESGSSTHVPWRLPAPAAPSDDDPMSARSRESRARGRSPR
jgi:NhaP-type Na+/H+ or K+/H+ antiporter